MSDIDQVAISGEPISPTDRTLPPSNPIELDEHETTNPFQMSEEDIEFLQSLNADPKPISIEFMANGEVQLSAAEHVGVVTTPSGLQIQVTPKQTITNLLWALQFAFDIDAQTVDATTELSSARTFVDALGALYANAVEDILDQGLHRDYVRRQEVANQVRGRIDLTKQLQRSTPVPTDFEIEYDAHTADTILNQGILTASRKLVSLVNDSDIANQLDYQRNRLRKHVSKELVTPTELEQVNLTRLNQYYETALSIARIILTEDFFEDISPGERQSFALFLNMNHIFETMVERAFREASSKISNGVYVDGQASIPNLIDGSHAVSMRPDVLVSHSETGPQIVADAKWKTRDSSSSSDIYQLTSYILALETPGLIVYPQQSLSEKASSTVDEEYPLRSITLPTAAPCETYEEYKQELIDAAGAALEQSYDEMGKSSDII
jgi:5-methylcytosine-specific restriction enzyme subunit McrC